MTHRITASWDTLAQQSREEVKARLNYALDLMDTTGLEYKQADAVALVRLMTMEFQTASMSVAVQNITDSMDALRTALLSIAEELVANRDTP